MSARIFMLTLVLIQLQTTFAVWTSIATCQNVTVGYDPTNPTSTTEGGSMVYEELQVAFEDIATGNYAGDCFFVSVASGHYKLTKFFSISSSFVLHGDSSENVSVTIEVDEVAHRRPPYALMFENVEYVEISGIQFERSPGILGIVNVTEVNIEDSSFRWFEQGAVDIYQCFAVTISNSTFEHNGPVSMIRDGQYRGHGAGISIGFDCEDNCNGISLPPRVGVSIHDCRFLNNTDDPIRSSVDQAVIGGIFPGRGGAISVCINSTFEFNITLSGCQVNESKASSFGSGVYIVVSGYSAHHLRVNNTVFTKNTSPVSGALTVGYLEGSDNGMAITLGVHNCRFEDNEAVYGGGIFLNAGKNTIDPSDNSSIAIIDNCTFERNSAAESGAAVSVFSELIFGTYRKVPVVTVIECTFHENDGGRGGVFTTGYLPLIFKINNVFSNNLGRVLVVIGTRAGVVGNLLLSGNDGSGRDGSGIDGGALYMTSFSQMEFWPGANVSFINNTGLIGAALIVVNTAAAALPPSFRHVRGNPLCVLRYSDPNLLPDQWEDVSMTFSGNVAGVGSSVFISGLEFCSYPNRDLQRVFRWNFTMYSNNLNFIHYPNFNSSEWYVETATVSINASTEHTMAYPGEPIEVQFSGYDELQRLTAAAIRLSSADGFLFTPSIGFSEMVSTASIKTTFMSTNATYTGGNIATMKVEALLTENPSIDSFNIVLVPCPAGYRLVSLPISINRTAFLCECDVEDNLDIQNCNGSYLMIRGEMWAAAYHDRTAAANILFTYPCPSEYCRCSTNARGNCITAFSSEAQNMQCSCNRGGILCGDCTNHTAFSALLNKCVDCKPRNVALIAALVFADIVVIGILLVIKVGPPSWIYPTLFYVQVIPYLAEGFAGDFARFQPYAIYIGSALSFYFAYDFCLFPKTTPIFMYFLRYIPFFITIALTLAVIAFRYFYKLKRFPWYGLWWVMLFQYSHLVHTSLTILNCPKLPHLVDGNFAHRWYVNGNIECFTGFHTALAVLAIAVLTFCVGIIPVIVIYAQGYVQKPVLLSMSIKPLSEWFMEDYPWWPAVELTKRLVFVLLAITGVVIQSDYPMALYLALCLTVFAFVQPYRQQLYNYLDMLLTTGAVLLITTKNSTLNEDVAEVRSSNNYISPSEDCESDYVKLSWGILIFYYLPAVAFVTSFLVAAVVTIVRKCRENRHKPVTTIDEPFDSISYRLAGNRDATTFTMETLPYNDVPLTAAVQLNRQDLSDSRVTERRQRHKGLSRFSLAHRYHKKQMESRWTSQQFSWRTYVKKRERKKMSRTSTQSEISEMSLSPVAHSRGTNRTRHTDTNLSETANQRDQQMPA